MESTRSRVPGGSVDRAGAAPVRGPARSVCAVVGRGRRPHAWDREPAPSGVRNAAPHHLEETAAPVPRQHRLHPSSVPRIQIAVTNLISFLQHQPYK